MTDLAQLAGVCLDIEDLRLSAMEDQGGYSNPFANLQTTARMMRSFAEQGLANGYDFRDLLGDLTSEYGPLHQIQQQAAKEIVMEAYRAVGAAMLRSQLREVASKRTPDVTLPPTFDHEFHHREGIHCALKLRNLGNELHDCLIVVELVPNGNTVASAAVRDAKQKALQAGVLRALGMDDATLAESAKTFTAYWARLATNDGAIVYLESWGQRRSIEFDFGLLQLLMTAGESARIDIYADEGRASIPLSVSDMQAYVMSLTKPTRER